MPRRSKPTPVLAQTERVIRMIRALWTVSPDGEARNAIVRVLGLEWQKMSPAERTQIRLRLQASIADLDGCERTVRGEMGRVGAEIHQANDRRLALELYQRANTGRRRR